MAANEKAWQAALQDPGGGRFRGQVAAGAGRRIDRRRPDGRQRAQPIWNRDDVLMCSPAEREAIAQLNWADGRCASGAFDAYRGDSLRLSNKTVLAVGGDESVWSPRPSRKRGSSQTGGDLPRRNADVTDHEGHVPFIRIRTDRRHGADRSSASWTSRGASGPCRSFGFTSRS